MKKSLWIIILLLGVIFISGCQSETSFVSHPVGYGLVDEDHVAQGSFDYLSSSPNNPNSFFLTVYALPSIWAEVNVYDEFDEDNPNIEKLVDGEWVRYYAKFILIGNEFFTLVVDETTNPKEVSYQNIEGIDIIDLLDSEEQSKWYIEQVNLNSIYITDHERIPYETYKSILYDVNKIHFISTQSTGIFISYVGENETMPDFSENFKYYDHDLINQLFNRALDKAFDPEYKVSESK